MYADFYLKAAELSGQGIAFATAIVVRAEKPTSGKPGDKAIITAEGEMFGWIGGSCAQPTIIKEARKAIESGSSRFIRLSPNPEQQPFKEGVYDLPMTCFSGGVLEIYVEPQLPTPRLLIVGTLPIAQALARLGKLMNYQVIVLDLDKGEKSADADEIITDFEQIPARITPLTYVVVASHGNYDEPALEYALQSAAAYVALVASPKRARLVLDFLKGQGLTENHLAKLKYPAGLDIRARENDEIALSIMAEIVQKRRERQHSSTPGFAQTAQPAEATDPVCGMAVIIEKAKFTFEHEGQIYYFCCPACRKLFANAPQEYIKKSLVPSP
jgi:xanthine dehydrogenase accessory factor